MASALRAPWLAAYVERPGSTLSADDRARLAAHLRLVESLEGETVVLSGDNTGEALLELARHRNVTRIIVGKPTHARWRDFVFGSVLDDIVRGSADIDVHVIAGEAEQRPAPSAPPPHARASLGAYARGALPVLVAAGVAALMPPQGDLADTAMLFLVAIATTAAFLGRGPSLLASVLAVAVFDFFFVPPFHTFSVANFHHVLTFLVMLLAGVLLSSVMERIRHQSMAARQREQRTAALFALTRALARARDAKAIAGVAAEQIREVFESHAVLLVPDEHAAAELGAPDGSELTEVDRTVARWALEHGAPAGRGLEIIPEARVLGMPLLAEGHAVGVLAVVPEPETRFTDPAQRHLLETFVAQIALALERALLAEETQRAQLRAETEEMRSSLLSSVSHDLRTPIGTVLGAATTLHDRTAALSVDERIELAGTIRDEASRLARLVSNLLDMTRVESGGLDVKKEWVPVEEIVGTALGRVEARLAGRDVHTEVAPEILVPVDPVLVEQVLVNLLENALKHTPDGTPIEVRAEQSPGHVTIEVSDRGPGVAEGNETRIFEKFVRASTAGGGVGLGLAICRGIVQAHGGTIEATNRAGGGATFRITLPVDGEPPEVPSDDETLPERDGASA